MGCFTNRTGSALTGNARKVGEVTMDRERIIYDIGRCICHVPYACRELLSDALELLKEQNVCENCAIAIEDRQPVVLCKDCEHSKSYSNGKMFGCEFGNGLHEPDWFCADGERRCDDG